MKFNTKLDKNETIDKEEVKFFVWGGGFNDCKGLMLKDFRDV